MLVVSVAALSQVSIGTAFTWIFVFPHLTTANTTSFLDTGPCLSYSCSELSKCLFVAGLVAFLIPSGWMVVTLGRRLSLGLTMLVSAATWTLNGLATTALLLLIGSFFTGLSVAMLKVSVTAYVTEVIISGWGRMLVCLEMMKIAGGFISIGLSLAIPWNYIPFINLAWMAICLVPVFFFPESPAYLVTREHEVKAKHALKRLRDFGCDIEEEFHHIKTFNTVKRVKIPFIYLFKRPLVSRLMGLLGLSLVSAFSGSGVIIITGADMLLQAKFNGSKEVANVMLLLALTGGCFVLFGIVDRIGRRLCLLLSLGFLMLTYIAITITIYVSKETTGDDHTSTLPVTRYAGWNVGSIVLIFFAAFCLTLGIHTVPTILAAEYFPAYCRPQGLAIFFTSSVLFHVLWLYIQRLILTELSVTFLFWQFSIGCMLGIIYTLFIHETNHRRLVLLNMCKWLYRENIYELSPYI